MRNDATQDPDVVPTLRASREHDEPYPPPEFQVQDGFARERIPARHRRRGSGSAPLWVLVVALFLALGGLALWSYRQIALLEMQLVATQDSFARISEDAAGRLSDIRGQVVAAESSVTTESEALKLRLRQLEQQMSEALSRQQLLQGQQRALEDRQGGQDKRLEQQEGRLRETATQTEAQQAALAELASRAEALGSGLTALQKRLADQLEAQAGLPGQVTAVEQALDGVRRSVAELQQRGTDYQAVDLLAQDLLVLRSQLENRPTDAASTAEFDAFRAQVTRNINALQSQIANLQSQLDARR